MRKQISVFIVVILCLFAVSANVMGEEPVSDPLLDLGTEKGIGGTDFMKFDRNQIKHQITSFIPPLYRPAFTNHAFVLPPRLFSVSVTNRFAEINGDDFFKDGDEDEAFKNSKVERQLTDFSLFYGFDLNRKYLHGFTFRLNIPYRSSQVDGFVHPNGQEFISLFNAGSTQEIGDIGLFLKKKLMDQGNGPFGLAVVGAVFLPTGSNDAKFGTDGRIVARRPQPPNTTVANGFDALQKQNVANGTWGDERCFFLNFNEANRATCNNNPPFGAPAAGPLSFAPGATPGPDGAFIGDFPFNGGRFGRFSDDGRLPATLQPGTGDFSYLLGIFLTRQFDKNEILGRSALHLGLTHRFVSEEDGIDLGDTTTYFASFVKPIYKDYLSLDLTLVAFDKEDDSYSGQMPEPEIHTCTQTDVNISVPGCAAVGDQAFVFEWIDRPAFSGGTTAFFAPSLIFSPDPQIRMTLSALMRIEDPDLGPAPGSIIRLGVDFIF